MLTPPTSPLDADVPSSTNEVAGSPVDANPEQTAHLIADTPVAQWQEQYQRQAAEAGQRGDYTQQRRLQSFGTWPVVILDVILLVVAQILLTIPVVIAAVALYVASGHHLAGDKASVTDLQNWLGTPQALAAYALATQAAILLILQLRVVGRGLLSWADLGFGPALRRSAFESLLLGVVLGIAALVLSAIVLAIFKGFGLDVSGQEESLKSVKHTSLAAFIPFAIAAALTAPIAEETFFRAYAFRALTVRYRMPIGLVVSAVFFGLLHLTGGVGWGAVDLAVIGVILAWGYARTGNPLTNISAHVLNNLVGLVVLYHGS
jgi:membrane protease YdiL (CAAX protease family)